ncbi:hypothetical protein EMCG_03564 [[Emmonsia] crescens]|uniref:Uncharacterized protein n=1 Tax=[Emmonsia] crescens TaxID=73230 RepID=A0A0G2J8B6_9EURO|nr:hypothetical protein EMCG_03564 [Emmonsia crescens UAMH 3008]
MCHKVHWSHVLCGHTISDSPCPSEIQNNDSPCDTATRSGLTCAKVEEMRIPMYGMCARCRNFRGDEFEGEETQTVKEEAKEMANEKQRELIGVVVGKVERA